MARWFVDIERVTSDSREIVQSSKGPVETYLELRREGAHKTGRIDSELAGHVYRLQLAGGGIAYMHVRRPRCPVCLWPNHGDGDLCEDCADFPPPVAVRRRREKDGVVGYDERTVVSLHGVAANAADYDA